MQVFDVESHASLQSSQTKEGLSLFGILNNTRTYLGRNLLYQWLLRPLASLDAIQTRHDAISCFLRGENLGVADSMHVHLKILRSFCYLFRKVAFVHGEKNNTHFIETVTSEPLHELASLAGLANVLSFWGLVIFYSCDDRRRSGDLRWW